MTIEEFRRLCADSAARSKKNKYGARRSGGYASAKERSRADVLKLMQKAGEISGLREQVRYELIPEQRDADGRIIEHPCAYIADFVYTDRAGRPVVEDTKGFRTREYIIKRKLMLRLYGIRIKEI